MTIKEEEGKRLYTPVVTTTTDTRKSLKTPLHILRKQERRISPKSEVAVSAPGVTQLALSQMGFVVVCHL